MQCESCGHANEELARFCAGCGALMPVDLGGDDPMIGQIVGGRYRITRILGEGGMGIVYEGEQQMGSTVRKVAVKTLHAHLSKDPSVLARFHRECGTVAQLEHPNTIKFFDFGATADGTLYIAMEFVKGEPLNEVIEKGGPISPDRVLKIMKQVCGALDEAHRQGIIHRDLKPENIILTTRAGETDFAKVLDFGIAARSESSDAQKEQKLTQQGMVLGTPPYMSPEQFTGKALDARSDIYSLGVLAYEMITGRLPFEADTPWQWATQHMTAQPLPFEATPTSSAVPEQMRKAIMRALLKERTERQETARAFFEELSGGGGLTVEAPIKSAPAPTPQGSGTAAMAAAPNFAASAAGAVAPPTPTPQFAPPVVAPAAVMAAPVRSGSGGGKGLIIGLGSVGALLLIGIIVVAARSMKPTDDVPLTNPFTSAGPASTELAPTVDEPEGVDVESTVAASGDPSAPTSTGGIAGKATGQPKPTDKPPPDKPPPDKPPADPKAACAACIAAAQSGNIVGAASSFRSCTDGAQKSRCTALARRAAPGAVTAAARNGNCPQAKATAAAASAMGAGSGFNMGSCK